MKLKDLKVIQEHMLDQRGYKFDIFSNAKLESDFDVNSPIKATKMSQWREDQEGFYSRSFPFKDTMTMQRFILSATNQFDIDNHHGKVIILKNDVMIKLITHVVNEITEIDLDMAKMLDYIYEDIEEMNINVHLYQ